MKGSQRKGSKLRKGYEVKELIKVLEKEVQIPGRSRMTRECHVRFL